MLTCTSLIEPPTSMQDFAAKCKAKQGVGLADPACCNKGTGECKVLASPSPTPEPTPEPSPEPSPDPPSSLYTSGRFIYPKCCKPDGRSSAVCSALDRKHDDPILRVFYSVSFTEVIMKNRPDMCVSDSAGDFCGGI